MMAPNSQHAHHVSAKEKGLLATTLSTSPPENETHTLPAKALCISKNWSRHLDSVRIGDGGHEGRPQAGFESKDWSCLRVIGMQRARQQIQATCLRILHFDSTVSHQK